MVISGLQKTTLLDYPEHVSATIFIGGCNFRCPFCHNMNIAEEMEDAYTEKKIMDFLVKRAGVLDAVCITGGEPTLNNDLTEFIKKIKCIEKPDGEKYLIKLDTNGTNPEMLKYLIDNNYIDYVAMDIKTSINGYEIISGIEKHSLKNVLIDNVKKSVSVLLNANIPYEFRTTLIKEYHNETVIKEIGELIKGADKYYLQSFVDSEYVPNHSLTQIDKETLLKYKEIMMGYVKSAELRGVD